MQPRWLQHASFPVLHHLLEFAQTHVHWVDDAIQPFHPLSPSSPALNLSQNQGLFQWVGSSHQVAKALERQPVSVVRVNFQGWFPWGWTGLISLQSKGLSRVFSNTTVRKHQFFGAQPLKSIHDYWKNHSIDYMDLYGFYIYLLSNKNSLYWMLSVMPEVVKTLYVSSFTLITIWFDVIFILQLRKLNPERWSVFINWWGGFEFVLRASAVPGAALTKTLKRRTATTQLLHQGLSRDLLAAAELLFRNLLAVAELLRTELGFGLKQ